MHRKSVPIILLLLAGIGLVHSQVQVHSEVPVISPPGSGRQLFFDDFVNNQFPAQWTGKTQQQINNSTQLGGYLVSTLQRNQVNLGGSIGLGLLGNNSDPVVRKADNSSFTQITFKLVPFNMSNPYVVSQASGGTPINDFVIADLQIGLAKVNGIGNQAPGDSIFFNLVMSTVPLSQLQVNLGCSASSTAKTAVYVSTPRYFQCPVGGTGVNDGMLYNAGNSPIDLTSMHTFTIQFNKNTTDTSKEWARYQVDTLGWMIFYQSSCFCFNNEADSANLWPTIVLDREIDNFGVGNPPFLLSQSLAVQVDYVAAYDYQVGSGQLPLGQLLTSNINPPKTPICVYACASGTQSGNIVQLIQYQSNILGGGNIYAGGFFLTGLILLIFTGVLGMVARKTGSGFRGFGFIWAIFSMSLGFFMLYAGVVPVFLPVLQVVFSIAIMLGVLTTVGSGRGGIVPD